MIAAKSGEEGYYIFVWRHHLWGNWFINIYKIYKKGYNHIIILAFSPC